MGERYVQAIGTLEIPAFLRPRQAGRSALAALVLCTGLLAGVWTWQAIAEETKGDMTTEDVAETIRQLREEGTRIRFQPSTSRDPFNPLIVQIGPEEKSGPRPAGFPGFNVSEVRLEGVWLSISQSGGTQAFFVGSDGKSYRQKVGDKCYNGKLIAIREDRVIFEEYQFDTSGLPRPPKIVTLFIEKRDS